MDDSDYPGAISTGRAPDATKVVAHPYVSAMDDPLRRIVDPVLNVVPISFYPHR